MAGLKPLQKPEEIFVERLVKAGYTSEQAKEFIGFVEQFRAGRGKVSDQQLLAYLRADSKGYKADFEAVMKSWDDVAKGKTKVSQLSAKEIDGIISGLHLLKQAPPKYTRLNLLDEEILLPPPYFMPTYAMPKTKQSFPEFVIMFGITVPKEKSPDVANYLFPYMTQTQIPKEPLKIESVPKKNKQE